jgi:dihydroorotase
MGSSTGNMLVDNPSVLEKLFAECRMLIAVHCEDEETILSNMAAYRAKFGEDVPMHLHPIIRSEEACYKSSSLAVELANRHDTRLHILHISTAKELSLFSNNLPLGDKRITAEACIHHLWFTDADYASKGSLIKWNPAVKKASDREAIRAALKSGVIDVVATDHAPHTLDEKSQSYFKAPSGGPLVQHAMVALLELVSQGVYTLPEIVNKWSHAVAECFKIKERGYIREGYYADLVLVHPNDPWLVTRENLLYKCKWSPFEGQMFQSKIHKTWVNGNLVYDQGVINEDHKGKRLLFNPTNQ